MVGVLALQGDFDRHAAKLAELKAPSRLVTTPADLDKIRALVIPGGESSVLLKLSAGELREKIKQKIEAGLPVLATCAGLIYVAARVVNPVQESLGVLDVDVARNAYGRQLDSFIEPKLTWTETGRLPIEGVFIRAPRITRTGKGVTVLVERAGEPVMVRQGNILGAAFHPELSQGAAVHELFLSLVS